MEFILFDKFERLKIRKIIEYIRIAGKSGSSDRIMQVAEESVPLLVSYGLNNHEANFLVVMEIFAFPRDLLSGISLPEEMTTIDMGKVSTKFKRFYKLNKKVKFIYKMNTSLTLKF